MPLQVEQPAFVPGFHELVDQGRGGGETHRQPPLAGGQAQSQGNVGLAGAAVAHGDDVFMMLDVLAPGQLHDQWMVHRGDGGEVKGVQALGGGEAGGADPALHHALVTVGEFQFSEGCNSFSSLFRVDNLMACLRWIPVTTVDSYRIRPLSFLLDLW